MPHPMGTFPKEVDPPSLKPLETEVVDEEEDDETSRRSPKSPR